MPALPSNCGGHFDTLVRCLQGVLEADPPKCEVTPDDDGSCNIDCGRVSAACSVADGGGLTCVCTEGRATPGREFAQSQCPSWAELSPQCAYNAELFF